MVVTQNSNGGSDEIPVNVNQNNFKLSVITKALNGFDGTYTVVMRVGDEYVDHLEMADLAADNHSNIYFPVHAVMVRVAGSSQGGVSLNVLQGA